MSDLPPPPPPPPIPVDGKPLGTGKKPFYRRWWFITIVVLFVIGIVGNLAGSGDDDKKVSAAGTGATTTAASATTVKDASTTPTPTTTAAASATTRTAATSAAQPPATTASSKCTAVETSVINNIGGTSLKNGAKSLDKVFMVAVPASKQANGFPAFIVAARIVGPDVYGTWGIGAGGGGPIWAFNSEAQRYTVWLEAAAPGSNADKQRNTYAAYPEATTALDCARA